MLLNPDKNKQVTEVYFSQKHEKSLPPPIIYPWLLSWMLSFNDHVNQKINKCNIIIGLMKRLSLIHQETYCLQSTKHL